MKSVIFLFLSLVLCNVQAADSVEINFKSVIGEREVAYNLNQDKTKPDQLQFFLKKSRSILKLKSHDLEFCKTEKFELTLKEGSHKKTVMACVRSKTKLTKEMKNLANLLHVQYANP